MDSILERDDEPEATHNPQPTTSQLPNINPHSEIDRELEEILKKQAARIKVIGIGGAGGNTTSRMQIGRAHV